jgi:hypothetical protein
MTGEGSQVHHFQSAGIGARRARLNYKPHLKGEENEKIVFRMYVLITDRHDKSSYGRLGWVTNYLGEIYCFWPH